MKRFSWKNHSELVTCQVVGIISRLSSSKDARISDPSYVQDTVTWAPKSVTLEFGKVVSISYLPTGTAKFPFSPALISGIVPPPVHIGD